MRITIVNRYYPPDTAPTGVAAAALAARLATALPRAHVRVVTTTGRYPGATTHAPTAGTSEVTGRVRVDRVPWGGRGESRLGHLIAALGQALALAIRSCRSADVVITLTDPPFLAAAVGLVARLLGRRWVEWTMDVYPRLFVAAGLISDRHPAYRLLAALDRRLERDALICLGPQQRAWIESVRGHQGPVFIIPAGIPDHKSRTPPAPPAVGPPDSGQAQAILPITLVYAGNLGPFHLAPVLAQLVHRARARALPIRFRFAAGGEQSAALAAALPASPWVDWCQTLGWNDLAYADVHLAALAPAATHLCVPSKAITALGLGRPIVWIGTPDSDIWCWAAPAGWHLPLTADGSATDQDCDRLLMALLDPVARRRRTDAAGRLAAGLKAQQQAGYDELIAWLVNNTTHYGGSGQRRNKFRQVPCDEDETPRHQHDRTTQPIRNQCLESSATGCTDFQRVVPPARNGDRGPNLGRVVLAYAPSSRPKEWARARRRRYHAFCPLTSSPR